MKLHNLKPACGSTHSRRRIGRGPGSGLGGTSTRGHKGGQMPLQRRLPKFGFKNINRVEYQPINLSSLQKLAEANITTIGIEEMIAAGLAKKGQLVKVLSNGELTAKIDVTANAFSKSAEAAIQAVGGTATKL